MLTSSLKNQVDLPVWEWVRFAPVVTAAGTSTCSDESSGGRFSYYFASLTSFYRYDTYTDAWQQLASPTLATALTISNMRYTVYGG